MPQSSLDNVSDQHCDQTRLAQRPTWLLRLIQKLACARPRNQVSYDNHQAPNLHRPHPDDASSSSSVQSCGLSSTVSGPGRGSSSLKSARTATTCASVTGRVTPASAVKFHRDERRVMRFYLDDEPLRIKQGSRPGPPRLDKLSKFLSLSTWPATDRANLLHARKPCCGNVRDGELRPRRATGYVQGASRKPASSAAAVRSGATLHTANMLGQTAAPRTIRRSKSHTILRTVTVSA